MAEIQTIDEMREAYKAEWVFLADCETDEWGRPVRGSVVAHSPDRDDIYREMANYRETGDRSDDGPVRCFAVEYLGEIPSDIYYML